MHDYRPVGAWVIRRPCTRGFHPWLLTPRPVGAEIAVLPLTIRGFAPFVGSEVSCVAISIGGAWFDGKLRALD
jgi:hypothetical protein